MASDRRKLQFKIFAFLEGSHKAPASRIFSLVIFSLILLNVITATLSSMGSVPLQFTDAVLYFEIFCLVLFSYEYGLRLWSCTVVPRYRHFIFGRLRFMLTPLALIDLLVLVPFYMALCCADLMLAENLVFARIFRFIRLIRIFKLVRYSRSLRTLGRVIYNKREELIFTAITIAILIIVVSHLIYFAEYQAQPQAFASIPDAIWWSIITLSTVGYGDVYPITALGKILGAILALLGIGVFALPAGILAGGFQEELQRKNRNNIYKCPHCGGMILPSELQQFKHSKAIEEINDTNNSSS
jgi:voltage-gated potassium channel